MKIFPKPFYLLGDILSVSVSGALAALAAVAITPTGWPMLPAMIPGMLVGMLIALLLVPLIFSRYFGAMEVMVPSMLGAMLAGMLLAMRAVTPMDNIRYPDVASLGAIIGLLALCFCYMLNAYQQFRYGRTRQ